MSATSFVGKVADIKHSADLSSSEEASGLNSHIKTFCLFSGVEVMLLGSGVGHSLESNEETEPLSVGVSL